MREAPRDLHLRRDRAHHVVAGEKRNFVDRVTIAWIAHGQREIAFAIERHRNHAQLDRHVSGHGFDDFGLELGECVGADLRYQQALPIKIGNRVVSQIAGCHEVLANRAAGASHRGACGRQRPFADQARANQHGASVISHDCTKRAAGRTHKGWDEAMANAWKKMTPKTKLNDG